MRPSPADDPRPVTDRPTVRRLPDHGAQVAYRAEFVHREAAISILRPTDFWDQVFPWAALYR